MLFIKKTMAFHSTTDFAIGPRESEVVISNDGRTKFSIGCPSKEVAAEVYLKVIELIRSGEEVIDLDKLVAEATPKKEVETPEVEAPKEETTGE